MTRFNVIRGGTRTYIKESDGLSSPTLCIFQSGLPSRLHDVHPADICFYTATV